MFDWEGGRTGDSEEMDRGYMITKKSTNKDFISQQGRESRLERASIVKNKGSVRSLGIAFQLLALLLAISAVLEILPAAPCSHAIKTLLEWWHNTVFTTDN